MKYFIVSDIHGHYTEMINALKEVQFDDNNTNHKLIIVGDLFDRGLENLKLLDYIYSLLEKNKIILIKGNHDEFFFDAENFSHNHNKNGFNTTVKEFFGDMSYKRLSEEEILKAMFEKQPKLKIVLNSMVDIFKFSNYVITHAGFNPYIGTIDNWNNTPLWISYGVNNNDGNIYIFGHWSANRLNKIFIGEDNKSIFKYKNYIGLDSDVVLTKKIFVFVVEEINKKNVS